MTDQSARQYDGPGILIEHETITTGKAANGLWINVFARFPEQADHEGDAQFFRSLFLTCISQQNQEFMNCNLLKGKVLLPGDINKIGSDPVKAGLNLRVNLVDEFEREFQNDRFYIQVSARQYLSNQLQLDL